MKKFTVVNNQLFVSASCNAEFMLCLNDYDARHRKGIIESIISLDKAGFVPDNIQLCTHVGIARVCSIIQAKSSYPEVRAMVLSLSKYAEASDIACMVIDERVTEMTTANQVKNLLAYCEAAYPKAGKPVSNAVVKRCIKTVKTSTDPKKDILVILEKAGYLDAKFSSKYFDTTFGKCFLNGLKSAPAGDWIRPMYI